MQVYDCQKKEVEVVRKVPIPSWIKDFSFEAGEMELKVVIETSSGDVLEYTFDQDLELASQSRERKDGSRTSLLNASFGYETTLPSSAMKLVKATLLAPFTLLWKLYNKEELSTPQPKPYDYSSTWFHRDNKLFSYDTRYHEITITSLGKHLIPTQTPVFHNFERLNILIKDQQDDPELVHYLVDGVIHSESYINVFEVHPKHEAEWVGFSKNFIHFYPSKESTRPRMIRLPEGGLFFEGTQFKNTWSS